jgi:hypothetical protein
MATTAHTAAIPHATPQRRISGIRAPLTAAVAGLTAGGLVLQLASHSGGYFPDARLHAGAFAFGVLAVLLALNLPRASLSAPALLGLGSLAALTAWTALSVRWSSAPDVALDDFQRDLLYVGLLGLGLTAAGSGRYSRRLVWLVLVAASAILIAALVGRLYPSGPPSAYERVSQYRLSGPLGYWNALGALGALAVVLGAGLASDVRSHPILRGAASGLVVTAGVAAYMSFSRGAWLAFFVGIAVLAIAAPRRLVLLVSLAVCGAALLLALLRLQSYPALTGHPGAGAGQAEQGHDYGPSLIGLAIGAALLQGAIAWFKPHPEASDRLAFLGRRAAAVLGGIAVIAAAVLYLAHTNRAEGTAAAHLESANGWVSRQWSDFMNPSEFSQSGAQRLTSAHGTRSDLFRVAIDGFQAHPLRGDGAGGFEVRFAHDRRVPETVRNAHSLYLETIGELGAVGGLALIGLIGAFAWAATRARLRPRAMSRGQAAAAAAALSVWAAHCIVDWDWQVPALTGLALLLGAALMPTGVAGRRRSGDRMSLD